MSIMSVATVMYALIVIDKLTNGATIGVARVWVLGAEGEVWGGTVPIPRICFSLFYIRYVALAELSCVHTISHIDLYILFYRNNELPEIYRFFLLLIAPFIAIAPDKRVICISVVFKNQ